MFDVESPTSCKLFIYRMDCLSFSEPTHSSMSHNILFPNRPRAPFPCVFHNFLSDYCFSGLFSSIFLAGSSFTNWTLPSTNRNEYLFFTPLSFPASNSKSGRFTSPSELWSSLSKPPTGSRMPCAAAVVIFRSRYACHEVWK